MGSLLVVTGPPGAGKSSIARHLADTTNQSVLIEGDAFFGFLASGAIEPWLPRQTNRTGRHQGSGMRRRCVRDGRVHDGVRRRHRSVVPAHLRRRNGLERLDYAILLPSVEVCIRVATRPDHGFTDEAATRKMHAEFVRARVEDRHVLRNPSGVAADVAEIIESARQAGELTHTIR